MSVTKDQWKLDPGQQKIFADWGAHGCDILRWLVDSRPTLTTFAQYNRYAETGPPDQSTIAVFRFANGVMADVLMSFEIPGPGLGSAMQFLFIGSQGMIEVDAYGRVLLGHGQGWTTAYEQPEFDPLDPVNTLRLEAYGRQLADLVLAAAEAREPVVSGREEGLITQEMLDAAELSARSGRAVGESRRWHCRMESRPVQTAPRLPDRPRGLATMGLRTNGASVRLDGVARRYGAVQALDRLSLDLPVGKFVTLLGPSGCGKTTTLSLIAGLDQPDEGSIYLGERDITHVPPNERGMAIVFQNYALYPHMSVFGNLAFSLKLQRRGKSEIQRRVFEVAEILSIEHLLKRRPGQLSGGQQQRVAIGRALVKEPSVYLLDEPFSNLDAALRARMRTEIKRLHLSLGTTTIFVTHDQEEAMTLSDLVAVMHEGKLVQYGTQNEVYFRPKNAYVATFLGKPRMSLIEGVLERHESGVEFIGHDLHLTLGSAAELGLRDGTWNRVLAGMRAEDLSIVPSTSEPSMTFKAQVQMLEPVGSDTFVELLVGGSAVVARVAPDLPLSVGDNVLAQVRPGRVHLFDADTTERITG